MHAHRVGLVTDSNSQLPVELADRYGVVVVPLTVMVDGEAHAEGIDIDADDFFARWSGGVAPEVSTAAPPPGRFVEVYERLAAGGAEEILSIHIGSAVSGTLNAARLATGLVDVRVHLVDTGTASFGVSSCMWEAAEALAAGRSAGEAAQVAEALAPAIGNVFVVGGLDIVRAGGRLAAGTHDDGDVPVLSLVDGQIRRVGTAADVAGATDVMVGHALAAGDDLRVAVGIADRDTEPLSLALEERLRAAPAVREVVRYRVGPSVGVHTGPGTVGCFFWPARA